MYVDYDFFSQLYDIDEVTFDRLLWSAERKVEAYCTGVDGHNKLRRNYPTDEFDSESVQRCICDMINIMYHIEEAQKSAEEAEGYITNADGNVMPKKVASISSGSESISFASSSADSSIYKKVLTDSTAKEMLLKDTIENYLGAVADSNGVNLLYGGIYPKRCHV